MVTGVEVEQISKKLFSLDVRGHVCPYPELLTIKALQSLSSGDALEVVLDNPPSVKDIPITLQKRGHKKLRVSRLDQSTWKIIVQV